MLLKPSEIRFSQEAINNYFKEGTGHGNKLIGETLDDICEGRCEISDIPMILVKMIRNHWTTADNRRLWVFRQLERLGKCTEIQVRITGYIDPRKLSSRNGGVTVRVRRDGPGGVWYLKEPEQSPESIGMTEQLSTQNSRPESTCLLPSKTGSKTVHQNNRIVVDTKPRIDRDTAPYIIDASRRCTESRVNNDEYIKSPTVRSDESSTTMETNIKTLRWTPFISVTSKINKMPRQTGSGKIRDGFMNEAVDTLSNEGFQEMKTKSFSEPAGRNDDSSCRLTKTMDDSKPHHLWHGQSDINKPSVPALLNTKSRGQVPSNADFPQRKFDKIIKLKDFRIKSSVRNESKSIEHTHSRTLSNNACNGNDTVTNIEQSVTSLTKMNFQDKITIPVSKSVDEKSHEFFGRSVSDIDTDKPPKTTGKKKDESRKLSIDKSPLNEESFRSTSKMDTDGMETGLGKCSNAKDHQISHTKSSMKFKSKLPYSIDAHVFHDSDDLILRKRVSSHPDVTNERRQGGADVEAYRRKKLANSYDGKQATAQPIIAGAVKERLQVAAIDFGTTYSGYAFSFRNDFLEDPLKIVTNQWTTGSNQSVSLKTSTCILFEPSGKFYSFGFDAEDKYADLAAEEEHNKWFFFKRFKMLLYGNQDLSRRVMLKDNNGNEMPAMKVFSESIKFLKNHFLDSCTDRQYGLEEDEIHWVLTVPAIWDDTAKLFMREAAIEAGIDSDHLSLALEPEAASMFCKHLPVNKIQGAKGAGITCFGPGTRYMVLDAGGGTVDITVHETQRDHTVKELYKANGGPWGGTRVDEAFHKFLTDISSPESLEQFRTVHMEDYLDIMREFEIKKTMTSPDMDQRITIKIPVSFHETYARIHGDELRASRVVPAPLKLQISFTGDKLRVQPEVIQGFFGEVCQKIIDHLRDIFNKREVRGTDTILMVGGFSESKMLQDAVRRNFPDKTVIIPAEAGLAVLKGAVIFGHNPTVITTRVSRFTYGINMFVPFQTGVHPIDKLYEGEDGTYCKDTFDVHVNIGDQVEEGTTFQTHSYLPISSRATCMAIEVYTSDQTNPSYTDEPGCERIVCIKVDLPNAKTKKDKEVNVFMKYGGTELHVEATVVKNNEKVNSKFDFLE